MKPLYPATAAALEADRESLNHRFRVLAAQGVKIDAEAFMHHMRSRIDPIVQRVDSVLPERSRRTTNELYDVSLELFRAGLWGKESRSQMLDRLWDEVLPELPHQVARDPKGVSGLLSNATLQLVGSQSRVDEWLHDVCRLGQACASTQELTHLGLVLAWKAGFASYRTSALKILRGMKTELVNQIFDRRAHLDKTDQDSLLSQLEEDRWLDPKEPEAMVRQAGITLVHEVGAFRGYGGSFLDVPSVGLYEGQLCATDGSHMYRIDADRWGWHLNPLSQKPPFPSQPKKKAEVSIDSNGLIHWKEHRAPFNQLAKATSQAYDGQTLAVTIPTSFHIFLLAWTVPRASHPIRSDSQVEDA